MHNCSLVCFAYWLLILGPAWTCQEPSIQFVHLHASAYTVTLCDTQVLLIFKASPASHVARGKRCDYQYGFCARSPIPTTSSSLRSCQGRRFISHTAVGCGVRCERDPCEFCEPRPDENDRKWSDNVNTRVFSTFKFRKIGSVYLDWFRYHCRILQACTLDLHIISCNNVLIDCNAAKW